MKKKGYIEITKKIYLEIWKVSWVALFSTTFDWLEISLVFNKSDKHTTIYDSYNAGLQAKYIKSVKLTNATEIYSLTNAKKYDMDNLTQKHLLYKQFVT